MKTLFTSFFIVLPALLVGQTGYKIEYERDNPERSYVAPVTFNGEQQVWTIKAQKNTVTVVFNDSLGHIFSSTVKNRYSDTDTVFGSKARHHDFFFRREFNEKIHYTAYPRPKRPYLLIDSLRASTFVMLEDNVSAYNMNCQKGYMINNSNDTSYVLISKEIKEPYGPYGYTGVPGLVLESYRFRNGDYLALRSIQEGNFIIQIPKLKRVNLSPYPEKKR